ncbi:MAG: VOC family protein [Ferruginibacter sp.]
MKKFILTITVLIAIVYAGYSQNKTKKMNMQQRLSVITIGASNLTAMKDFYINTLGWKPVAENKDIVFFNLNGFMFSLFGRKQLAENLGVSEEGSGFRAFNLAYNVNSKNEVDEIYQKFKVKGVKILKEPESTPFGGYFFTFSDVEGNILEIAFNPYIPLDNVGNTITHKSIDNL